MTGLTSLNRYSGFALRQTKRHGLQPMLLCSALGMGPDITAASAGSQRAAARGPAGRPCGVRGRGEELFQQRPTRLDEEGHFQFLLSSDISSHSLCSASILFQLVSGVVSAPAFSPTPHQSIGPSYMPIDCGSGRLRSGSGPGRRWLHGPAESKAPRRSPNPQ